MTRCGTAIALLTTALAAGTVAAQEPAGAGDPPLVYAASSLREVLPAIAEAYAADTGASPPRLVFGGSSRLARQIESGAPADLVITADEAWMTHLRRLGCLDAGGHRTLATNRLVLVVPAASAFTPRTAPEAADSRLRRIAVAASAVPAGRRAEEALQHHGLLPGVAARLVRAPNVRAALALVVRGEADAGIVYATDATSDAAVRIAFTFGADAHQAIRYPAALTRRAAANAAARRLWSYLQSPAALQRFQAAGFQIAGTAAPVAASPPPEAAGVDWLSPLLRSVGVALLSLLLSIGPALWLGRLLARGRFRGKSLISTLLLVPLVLPPVVTGYLLLAVFGRNGPLGALCDAIGLPIAFSLWGAVVAAAVVGFPLLLIMTRNAVESVDPRYEQLAATLGLSPMQVFRRVTLPMALPGVLAGCVLAFARALGEFGATAMLAGDVPGETRTVALAVYAFYEQPGSEGAAHVLVAISVVLCLLALVGYERLTAAQQRRLADRAS
ncbi:MAG: molybdate ABC transporter permease subunit [Planctomycetota bacterium]|jgi:molybdate transport system permease protein